MIENDFYKFHRLDDLFVFFICLTEKENLEKNVEC